MMGWGLQMDYFETVSQIETLGAEVLLFFFYLFLQSDPSKLLGCKMQSKFRFVRNREGNWITSLAEGLAGARYLLPWLLMVGSALPPIAYISQ